MYGTGVGSGHWALRVLLAIVSTGFYPATWGAAWRGFSKQMTCCNSCRRAWQLFRKHIHVKEAVVVTATIAKQKCRKNKALRAGIWYIPVVFFCRYFFCPTKLCSCKPSSHKDPLVFPCSLFLVTILSLYLLLIPSLCKIFSLCLDMNLSVCFTVLLLAQLIHNMKKRCCQIHISCLSPKCVFGTRQWGRKGRAFTPILEVNCQNSNFVCFINLSNLFSKP